MAMLGKLKRVYFDGVVIGLTTQESVSRKTNSKKIIHKDNAGTGTGPLVEEALAGSLTVNFSIKAYYVDNGGFKTLNQAWFAGEVDNAIVIKAVAAGGDSEAYSKCLITSLDDDHPVDDYSTFSAQFQAFGTRTLATTV